MSNRLFQGLGSRRENGAAVRKTGRADPVLEALASLARDLTRGIEHFVLSTPDLDTPGFLNRLRRNAARLTATVDAGDVAEQRKWINQSLPIFGQLQRRYLAEREDELWRVIHLYQEHLTAEGRELGHYHHELR